MGEAFNSTNNTDIVKNVNNVQGLKKLGGGNEIETQESRTAEVFKNFDNEIEQSFKEFLVNNHDRKNTQNIQDEFNKWLDNNFEKLENLKNNEIASVIKPITFELNKEATLIELEAVQQNILGGKNLNMHIFSPEVDQNYITQLFSLNFEKKDDLLDLLNAAKDTRQGDNNIRAFQRIIADLNENGDDDDGDKARERLGRSKVDGKFGINTVKAFEKYISEHLTAKELSINTTKTTLDYNDIANLKIFLEQNENQETINLSHIQTITPQVAQELAKFQGEIDLSGLTSIDKETLTTFRNNHNNVKFHNGELISNENNTTIQINGEDAIIVTADNINAICTKLTQTPDQNTQPQNTPNSAGQNGVISEQNGAITQQNNTTESSGSDPYIENQDLGINYYDNSEGFKKAQSEKEAIELLTVGSANLIERIFGKHGYDEASALVIKGYDARRNGPESDNLKNLEKGLKACLDENGNFNKELLIKALKQQDLEDSNLSSRNKRRIGYIKELVQSNDKKELENQPYLKVVLGVLNDYFIKRANENITGIQALYNNELIGKNKELYQKEKEIEEETLRNIKKQLNELEEELNIDQDINKLTDEYAGMTVTMANIQKLLNTDINKFQTISEKYTYEQKDSTGQRTEEKPIFENLEEIKFACCLCDINADGKVDLSDRNTKTGQELFNLILDAQIEGANAMANILKYALSYAEKNGHTNTLASIKNLNIDFDNITSKDEQNIITKIQEKPIIMQYLREMLTKTSIENTRAIVLKGSIEKLELTEQEKKFWENMMNPEVDQTIENNMNIIVDKIKDELDKNTNLTEQQKSDLLKNIEQNPESIKRSLKFAFAGFLSLSDKAQLAGAQANLGDIFKEDWLNNFYIGAQGGYYEGAILGLSLGYGNRRNNQNGTFSRDFGANIGGNYNFGSNGFNLLALACTGPEFQLNHDNLQHTLDADSAKYLGAHAIGLGFTNFSKIFGGGGADFTYREDQLAGIEQISQDMSVNIFESLYKVYTSLDNKSEIQNKDIFVKKVSEQLKNDFQNTDQDQTFTKYANILYTGLSYYIQQNNGDELTPAEVGKIFNNISQDFALNRKNTATAALQGKTRITGGSLGLIYVANYRIPIASLTTTNYENLFAHDTQESRNRYEQSLNTELGMELKALDDNDGIGPRTIDYLNKKLSIFFPRGDMPDIKLRSYPEDSNSNCLYIPKNLCNIINISYNQNIKDNIVSKQEGEDEYFVVPKNMRIGLSTYIGGGTMRANLILGDNKKSSGDTPLTVDSSFKEDNDPNKYTPDNERISLFDINHINNQLNTFRGENNDFPLRSCERANGEQIVFNTDGRQIDIATNSRNTLLKNENKISIVGKPHGELKVVKGIDNKYTISFVQSNDNKLSIKYEKYSDFTGEFNFNNSTIDALFNGIEDKLEEIDNKKDEYGVFMKQARMVSYDKAFENLMIMLRDNPNDDFKPLVDYLNKIERNEGIGEFDKMLVVDRFKAIFSYNKDLTTYDNVTKTIGKRKNKFETLPGYAGTESYPFPLRDGLGVKYRKEVIERLRTNDHITRVPHKNLIGMTAFYRYDNTEAQSFLLTELGGTNVLGDAIMDIQGDKIDDTRKRLLANLEKNPTYEKALLKSITNSLNTQFDESLTAPTIHEKLSLLLQGQRVDIGQKKVTIKPKFVFYLLGECGNESIGVEIEGVEAGSYSDSIDIEDYDISRSSQGLYVRTQATENQMDISATNHVRGISSALGGGPNQGTGHHPNSSPNQGTHGGSN